MIAMETMLDQAPQSALPVRRGIYVDEGNVESLKSGNAEREFEGYHRNDRYICGLVQVL